MQGRHGVLSVLENETVVLIGWRSLSLRLRIVSRWSKLEDACNLEALTVFWKQAAKEAGEGLVGAPCSFADAVRLIEASDVERFTMSDS
eukprot:763147-Hanusia_phi.AAC.1